MLTRKTIFPNVIELNIQAGHLIGCNVYLIYDHDEWALIDIGYQDHVEELIELIRELDFPLSKCKTIIATHADVDHGQGLSLAKQMLKTTVTAHPRAAALLTAGDRLQTFAEIVAQGISEEMPPVEVEHHVNDGDVITIGNLKLEVWLTPGHADCQLAFRMGIFFSAVTISIATVASGRSMPTTGVASSTLSNRSSESAIAKSNGFCQATALISAAIPSCSTDLSTA